MDFGPGHGARSRAGNGPAGPGHDWPGRRRCNYAGRLRKPDNHWPATAVVALLPAGVVWTFAVLLLLRFFFGAFQAGGFPVWARVVADWVPLPERGSAQGTVWMFSRVGGAIAPFLFLWLFWLFGTW